MSRAGLYSVWQKVLFKATLPYIWTSFIVLNYFKKVKDWSFHKAYVEVCHLLKF